MAHDDGGRSWRRGNQGLTPRYRPDVVIAELNLPEPPPDADQGIDPAEIIDTVRSRPTPVISPTAGLRTAP